MQRGVEQELQGWGVFTLTYLLSLRDSASLRSPMDTPASPGLTDTHRNRMLTFRDERGS